MILIGSHNSITNTNTLMRSPEQLQDDSTKIPEQTQVSGEIPEQHQHHNTTMVQIRSKNSTRMVIIRSTNTIRMHQDGSYEITEQPRIVLY